jgi:hypothetical protein
MLPSLQSRLSASHVRLFVALSGLLAAGAAQAQDASFCTEPGLTVLADASGDVDFQFLPAGLPADTYDVESLQVAQPTQTDGVARLVFTLKVGSLTQLAPRQAWFATFEAPDKRTYGVRMVVDEEGAVAFQSYLVLVDTDGNVTEGRYPETGSVRPAAEGSSYDADGTIRIVVEAQNIGLRREDGLLSGFNGASLQQIPTGDTLTDSGDLLALVADGMPDDMSRAGEVAASSGAQCPSAAKNATARLGGGAWSIVSLMLLAWAGWRRRLRLRRAG